MDPRDNLVSPELPAKKACLDPWVLQDPQERKEEPVPQAPLEPVERKVTIQSSTHVHDIERLIITLVLYLW